MRWNKKLERDCRALAPRRIRFASLCAAATLFVAAFLPGCARNSLHQQETFVFGTRVEVLVHGPDAAKARNATSAVLREFDRLHRMLHAWQPSELTRLNEAIARGEREIEVSAELGAIIAGAAQVAASSDQLFNPAVGKLVGLWGFHNDEFKPVVPDAKALAAVVRAQPRMSDLVVAGQGCTASDRAAPQAPQAPGAPGKCVIRSANPSVQLDLGGYAKGYALDRATSILRAEGIGNALVNIGGNVMALGSKGGTPWRVGIQHPRAPTALAAVDLADGEAIGTSGDYQRYFELDGRRYCHLIDPRTGQTAVGVQAVTVLVGARVGAGALSDAASKPLFLAAQSEWRALAGRLGVRHVLRIDEDGRIHVTAAFRDRLAFATDAEAKLDVVP